MPTKIPSQISSHHQKFQMRQMGHAYQKSRFDEVERQFAKKVLREDGKLPDWLKPKPARRANTEVEHCPSECFENLKYYHDFET